MPEHRTIRLFTTGALVITGLAPMAGAAAATTPAGGGYTYTIISDSADGFIPLQTGAPALNNAGEVAFRTKRTGGPDQVLIGSGGDVTVVAEDDAEGFEFFEFEVALNARGDVAFVANLVGDGEAVVRGNGGALKTLATTAGQQYADVAPEVSVDDRRRVVFKAILDDDDSGLFSVKRPGQVRTHFLASETEFDGALTDTSVRGRRIAFTETTDDGQIGVFIMRGDQITPIVDTRGEYNFFNSPSLGPRNRVAVYAELEFSDGIFVANGGDDVELVADTTGPFGAFGVDTPSQNADGQVVFIATLDEMAAYGLYDGPNPETDKIIVPGDPLAGSTVLQILACEQALNDRGQIAFTARLLDGRDVVVRADPIP